MKRIFVEQLRRHLGIVSAFAILKEYRDNGWTTHEHLHEINAKMRDDPTMYASQPWMRQTIHDTCAALGAAHSHRHHTEHTLKHSGDTSQCDERDTVKTEAPKAIGQQQTTTKDSLRPPKSPAPCKTEHTLEEGSGDTSGMAAMDTMVGSKMVAEEDKQTTDIKELEGTLEQRVYRAYRATGIHGGDHFLWQPSYRRAYGNLQADLNPTISLNEYEKTMCPIGQQLLVRELVRNTISIFKYKQSKWNKKKNQHHGGLCHGAKE